MSAAKFICGILNHVIVIMYYDINLHPFLLARKDDLCNM